MKRPGSDLLAPHPICHINGSICHLNLSLIHGGPVSEIHLANLCHETVVQSYNKLVSGLFCGIRIAGTVSAHGQSCELTKR